MLDLEPIRKLIEVSEQYADRSIRRKYLVETQTAALGLGSNTAYNAALSAARPKCSARWVALLCLYAATGTHMPPGQLLVPRHRGIPDASPEMLAAWVRGSAGQAAALRDIFGPLPFRVVPLDPIPRAVSEGRAGCLAQAIYDERAFYRLPLLADALEDAGCTDAELLGHLRSPGPHVRGCWAADLVLRER
jgi:hypothetical protein